MEVPRAGGIDASFMGCVSSLQAGQPCDFGPFNTKHVPIPFLYHIMTQPGALVRILCHMGPPTTRTVTEINLFTL